MSKLIIFRRKDYQELKRKLSEDGIKIVSFSDTYDIVNNQVLDDIDLESVTIDISVLRSIEVISPSFFLFFERMVKDYFASVTYITDYNTEEFKEKVAYIFDDIEIYEGLMENPPQQKVLDELNQNHVPTLGKSRIVDLSTKEIIDFVDNFSIRIIGHDRFKDQLLEKMLEYKLFNSLGENKIYSLFLMGESGVGKTEVARVFHQLLKGHSSLAKINFGNYSSHDSLNSLIGSPRGYAGSENGEFFDKIKRSDTGVVLIDEFEKATPSVFNYFLEVLESGTATSSMGEILNLDGYVFVFTSNIASHNYESTFSPELRSRFNYISSFSPLSLKDKENYLYTRFSKYVDTLNWKFNKKLAKLSKEELVERINVEQYNNMRVLNAEIRKLFINYVRTKYGNNKNDKIWK